MKKIFTLIAAAAMTLSAYAETATFGSANIDGIEKDNDVTCPGFTIPGTYFASGSSKVNVFGTDRGMKLRANKTDNTIIFNVDPETTITKLSMGVVTNDANSSLTLSAVAVDGVAVEFTPVVTPNTGDADGSTIVSLSDIKATSTISFSFNDADYTGKNKQVFVAGEVTFEKGTTGGDTPDVEGTPIVLTLEDFSKYGKDDRFTTLNGVYNFDEATGVYTFPNFLGSKEAFSFTLEADTVSPNLHIVPQSGVTIVREDVWGAVLDNFTFNGLKDSFTEWTTYDGKNYLRLYDPKSYGWSFTYASKEQQPLVENPNPLNPADFRFYYKLSFNIVSKYGTPEVELSENPGNFNLVMEIDYKYGDTSAIDSIVTDAVEENAPVEYFNLQGIRVNEPAAGQIVIRRQGSKVSKVVVR
ncbi:MAG: hypothetical protein NC411_06735 [Bacteroides sp.]|nr:hypothetical protein [Bacteroides sp.]